MLLGAHVVVTSWQGVCLIVVIRAVSSFTDVIYVSSGLLLPTLVVDNKGHTHSLGGR